VAAPDPIPNSAVKRPSADGTLSQGTGEQAAARSAKRMLKLPDTIFAHYWATQAASFDWLRTVFCVSGI
jgi:hypothetical protein